MLKILDRIVRFFIPKVGELLVDCVHENIRDFKFTLDSLERNLKPLSDRAFDVEKQIKNAELLGQRKRKREVENWLTEVKSIETKFGELENEVESEGFISRFMVGGKAAQLNAKVTKLVEQSRHFGEILVDDTRAVALLTTTLTGKAFEENLVKILKLLVIDKVSSIGIHGMGGVGKTTLIQHIHNRLLKDQTEESVIWVTVSQTFTITVLQDKIARAVGVELSDKDDQDIRAARLYQSLSQRKNILILDDVWEDINLEKVGYPIDMDGFRLVITTRSIEVCRQIGCREMIKVEPLHIDEAWHLFSKTLGERTKLAPQVEKIAKAIAKLCDGLPLGIITLAGSMKGETAIHVWKNALVKLKESIMEQDDMKGKVFKVLRYSFYRLNRDDGQPGQSDEGNPLQRCFLYCSLYPEDCYIPKDELVRKFIIEELMEKRKSRKEEICQGYSIVDKLVNVCLLESSEYYVKMHDLVRAMALKIKEGDTLVRAGQSLREIPSEKEWTKDLKKMSLMNNPITKIAHGMSPNCPKLSILLLQHTTTSKSTDSCFSQMHGLHMVLPDSFFSQMHGLCTLDLSFTSIKELPNSISNLERLKALLLRGCLGLEYVPYLGKLKALRELDLTYTAIEKVPQGIGELVDLKFLSLYGTRLQKLPTGLLLNFPYLQCLWLPNAIEAPIEEIEKLKHLEEFWGTVKNVRDFNQFTRSGRSQDTSYFIQVGVGLIMMDTSRLVISGKGVALHICNLTKGEEKEETMLGQGIQHLEIRYCMLSSCFLDDFPQSISDFRSLQSLIIDSCEEIECIFTSEQLMALEELQSQSSTLEKIGPSELWDFKGVIHKGEIGATVLESPSPRQAIFSSLTELRIRNCMNMKKAGLPVSEFPNLEILDVMGCEEIEEIIEVADKDDGRVQGESHFVSLTKLKELYLADLPELKSICKATMRCTSIQKITLYCCPSLKKLPLDVFPPPALREIYLEEDEKEWWESMEWEDPTHPNLLQPFIRFSEM